MDFLFLDAMKNIFTIIGSFLAMAVSSQQVKSFKTILNDQISIRALEIDDHKVWYSGTDAKFGFVDLKDPKNRKQIRLSDRKLQFRTLGQDKNAFYAINIESPAEFFKIGKKDWKYEVVFRDTAKTAFYDALHFVNHRLAYALSDSDKDNRLKLAVLKDGKWQILKNNLELNEGEAAFAASNTNIASTKKYLWIATGGKSSRIIRINLKNDQHEVFETPFIQGTSSQGMYSIDFAGDHFGIAVGGDYTLQEANINNIATTHDGGRTWQIQASGKNAGYMTCVRIRPGSGGKEMIAVGDRHISYSSDYGKSWTKISDEKNLYVCEWTGKNTVALAGKDRVAVLELTF